MLGNDASVIWALHIQQPVNFNSLQESAKVRYPRLRYDILPFLIDEGIVREVKHEGETMYVLSDYVAAELAVSECMKDFQLLHQRWPSLEEIASRVGKTPSEISTVVYKIAPSTGWKLPSDEDLRSSPYLAGTLLELAAWLKAGCADAAFVRKNWTKKQVDGARRILDRFPDHIPTIDAYTIQGDIRNRSGKKFYYTLTYPEIAIEIVKAQSAEPRMASYDDFSGCTERLKIQERSC